MISYHDQVNNKKQKESKVGNENYEQTLQNVQASPLWIPP